MRNFKLLLRDAVTALVIGVPLLVVAIAAWATHNPDHPRVEAARHWRVVGGWVARLAPATAATTDTVVEGGRAPHAVTPTSTVLEFTGLQVWFEAGTAIHAEPRAASRGENLGVPTRLDVVEQRGEWLRVAGVVNGWTRHTGDPTALAEVPSQHRTAWLRPGTDLLDQPGGAPVTTMDHIANLPVVATGDNAWVQVIYTDRKLWVEAPEFTGGEPPLGSAPTPLMPLAAVPLSAERLDSARSLFSGEGVEGSAGPYRLLGDSNRVRSLAAACAPELANVDAEFERRTGLAPGGPARETLLVFAARHSYQRFLDGAPRVTAGVSDPDGYSLPAQGFAATYFEGRSDTEVCAVLVHEAAHLTSRRALGPALPAWLAEGLATWLEGRSLTAIDPHTAGSLVRMEEEFYAADLDRRYRTVAAIVRALLTDPRWAPVTRAFLADRAAGQPLTGTVGAGAADYWTELIAKLRISEDALWRALTAVQDDEHGDGENRSTATPAGMTADRSLLQSGP